MNSFASKPHDLFLIPSGTVHCSGADNLVLEISATPYIFTFKIYDYLRSDLNGKLRHVHPERAFPNIDTKRRTAWVQANLLPVPEVIRQGPTWSECCLGDDPKLFFGVHRLEFDEGIEDVTDGKFVMLPDPFRLPRHYERHKPIVPGSSAHGLHARGIRRADHAG